MSTKISITPVARSRLDQVDFDDLGFGKYFCDHMFSMTYEDGAWQQPEVLPYGPVPIDPAASSLHYGQTVFEGLKAFRGSDGSVRVFRSDMNARRMHDSCERLCIPAVPDEVFADAIDTLIRLDRDWIPTRRGEAFYIRPLVFSTEGHLDVRPARSYRLLIMTSPVGVYFGGAFRPITLKVEDHYTRAAPGGMGFAKTGGNYAASLRPGMESLREGFDQVLWLDGAEHSNVEEVGQMNIVFGIDDGFVTAPLRGTILPGVTRDSVLTLLREQGLACVERVISIDEITEASEANRLREAFGCGTAAVICPVGELVYRGQRFAVADRQPGPVSRALYERILGIQLGEIEDPYGWTRIVDTEPPAIRAVAG